MDNEEKKTKTENLDKENSVGIRSTLNSMGISDKDIGYDNNSGYVTIGGRAFMKPSYLDEEAGVSYASLGDIRKNVVDFYKNDSNPVVRVSDAYAAAVGKYGLGSGGLSYGDGTVSIGGKPLNIMYTDDSGKAWARKNDVYRLAKDYVNRNNVKSPDYIAELYADRYLSDINSSLDSLRNREEFSYDPDDDSVYLAYKNKYLTEGDRASKNAMANYSALTGGYTNSAAVTAGAMANQYYAQQLTNTIPELAKQAYERYYDKYNTDLETIDKMLDVYDAAYKNAYYANNKLADNINKSAEAVVDRDNAAYERELQEFEKYWKNRKNTQEEEKLRRDSHWDDVLNEQKATQNDIDKTGSMLDNAQKSIYLEYYKRLLESQLESESVKRQKDIAAMYK